MGYGMNEERKLAQAKIDIAFETWKSLVNISQVDASIKEGAIKCLVEFKEGVFAHWSSREDATYWTVGKLLNLLLKEDENLFELLRDDLWDLYCKELQNIE